MRELPPEEDALSIVAQEAPSEAEPAHRLLGLTDEEYRSILDLLGREPTPAELAVYSVMWSEHCSYKSSRVHLGRLPTEAPWVVMGPGENAGVVDLGNGWCAALRIESHNHPSFVEPFQGAATGVGGIIRDILTVGARPVALWDQIRFGPIDHDRSRYLFGGVVSGIAWYGNAVGVPTVGGETAFAETYSANPLVNVMCLGLLPRDRVVRATAGNPGNVAVLLGAPTGRDGIGGASILASAGFDATSESKRPSVQVGDPLQGKKLIEACLELYERGLVVGIQDLGAGGISCAASETAARAGVGVELDLDRVHVREEGMDPAELLISESQERMLAFVVPERVEEVLEVARRWEVDASVVGRVVAGDRVVARHHGRVVLDLPAASLTDGAPAYRRPYGEPQWMEDLWSNTLSMVRPPRLGDALLRLLDDPSVASARWVYEQYDHMLFLDTVVGPGADASLTRVDRAGLVVSTDGNGRVCYLDPRRGAARLVWEAAANLATLGARPLAVVDNLNFGNPEDPDVMWQFVETVQGLAEACTQLGVPVVGGNVSFYNETEGKSIHPTPVVGMLGIVDPLPERIPRWEDVEEGDELWIVGSDPTPNLAGSAFEQAVFGHVGGRPASTNPTRGNSVLGLVRRLVAEGVPVALHDVSDGGLLVAVAELCIAACIGVGLSYSDWRALFSEDPHRIVAVVSPADSHRLVDAARRHGVEINRLGTFEGDSILLEGPDGREAVSLEEASATYLGAIPRRMATSHAT
jgi:phosphoribosylformylglycinamidine synthase